VTAYSFYLLADNAGEHRAGSKVKAIQGMLTPRQKLEALQFAKEWASKHSEILNQADPGLCR